MLYVNFNLKIGYMWKNDEDGNLVEQYDIYYSPNALFVACDEEKNLSFFANDEQHLKNMLGKTKEWNTNALKNFSFSFIFYQTDIEAVTRLKEIAKVINKVFTTGKLTNYFTITYFVSEEK